MNSMVSTYSPIRKGMLFALLLLIPYISHARWDEIGRFPGGQNDGMFSFTIGDTAYVGGGIGSLFMYRYTEASGWDPHPIPLPDNRFRAWAFSFSHGGKGYVGGGDTTIGFTVTDEFYEFDPATQEWKALAPLGSGPRDGCFAFVLGDYAYMGGGFDGQLVWGDVWAYSFADNVWGPAGNFPGGPVLFASSFVIDGKGFVVGGDRVGGQNEVYAANPATGSWEQHAPFPGSPRQAGIAGAFGSNGFFGGGMANYTTNFHDFWKYDSRNDQWSVIKDKYPEGASAWGVTFAIGDRVYAGSGGEFTPDALLFSDRFFEFTLSGAVGGVKTPSPSGKGSLDLSILSSTGSTSDVITLRVVGRDRQEVTFEVVSVRGEIVRTERAYTDASGVALQVLDGSDLPAGYYFIVARSGGETGMVRSVLLR